MAVLDAKTVYEKLGGNVYEPSVQAYKYQIAGNTVILFDLNGARCELRAEQVRYYVDKGFAFEAQAAPVAEAPPVRAAFGRGQKS